MNKSPDLMESPVSDVKVTAIDKKRAEFLTKLIKLKDPDAIRRYLGAWRGESAARIVLHAVLTKDIRADEIAQYLNFED